MIKKIIIVLIVLILLILIVDLAIHTPTSKSPVPKITFSVPQDFVLATTSEQVLVKSYIPPCAEGFNYCIYYDGSAYQGTNFESAGVRINKRADLTTTETCDFSGPTGDAGAGHYAIGQLHRLLINNTCYEFETRIGLTQFANYPPGTIKEFTKSDQAQVESELKSIVNSATIPKT